MSLIFVSYSVNDIEDRAVKLITYAKRYSQEFIVGFEHTTFRSAGHALPLDTMVLSANNCQLGNKDVTFIILRILIVEQ